jgi:hypothetical protein
MRRSGPVRRAAVAWLALLGLLSAAACDPWGVRFQRVDNISDATWIVRALSGDHLVAYSARLEPMSTIAGDLPPSASQLVIQLLTPDCEVVATMEVPASEPGVVIEGGGRISLLSTVTRRPEGLRDLGSTFGEPILCLGAGE